MNDADLLRGAQQGDADAWRMLHQRYLPSVWRQACALIADAHVAEDITSEAMLALLRGIHELEADGVGLAVWLRTVVHRKAMDHHRRSYRGRAHLAAYAETAVDATEGDRRHPLEIVETCNHVQRVLDEISERQRTLLQWKYVDDLGVREMAERLGETEKAVESVLYRARREFRRLFELERTSAATPCPSLTTPEVNSQSSP